MILAPTPSSIEVAVAELRSGGLVGIPTETVYGLAADARSAPAIAKVFALKGRPTTNPLIVHLASSEAISSVAALSDPVIRRRVERIAPLWPGPITTILPSAGSVTPAVQAGHATVAVRIPAHPIASSIIESFGGPLAAPSANRSTYVSPTTAAHVAGEFPERLLIIDGGPTAVGLESTVIDLTSAIPTVLRPGSVAVEKLSELLGETVQRGWREKLLSTPSPGLSPRHYAPRTQLVQGFSKVPPTAQRVAVIYLSPETPRWSDPRVSQVVDLSASLSEAAKQFFATLRELDGGNFDLIVVDTVTEVGIGEALADRIRRAEEKL